MTTANTNETLSRHFYFNSPTPYGVRREPRTPKATNSKAVYIRRSIEAHLEAQAAVAEFTL